MTISTRSLLAQPRQPSTPSTPLLEKGFRPFFLLGAVFASCAVPLWLVALRGGITPGGAFGPMQWHAHEMLFGFSTAIIAGFLLTAIGNWTSRETLTGAPLGWLAVLWSLGRLALFFAGYLPKWAPALIDLAFLPVLAFCCARPLFASKNRQNYGFLGMLALLGAVNLAAHAGAWTQNLELLRTAHRVALDVIALMIVVVTGRILPMFTRNATRQPWVRGIPALESASAVGLVALLGLDVSASPRAAAWVAGGTALFVLARMRFWASSHTWREPLLWILHIGAAWVPLGLMLRAISTLTGWLPASSALHALTAGAIGCLTLGMMARVSLGHTGRTLKAPRSMSVAFSCVVAAGVLRVAGPSLPSHYLQMLELSALAWSAAFGLFVVAYFDVLTTQRVDGH
ncbi:MAG TPA: NnrS family protein [Polyangiaceae bacterium]|jgi:uncharacterized protein involved in response to NO